MKKVNAMTVTSIGCFVIFHPNNVAVTHIFFISEYRLAFSQRNSDKVGKAVKDFEETIDRFPDCAEGYALYGQVSRIKTLTTHHYTSWKLQIKIAYH